MRLLAEYLGYINVDDSKMFINDIFMVENLSTYKWIQIELKQSNIKYYNKQYIKLVDPKSNFFKIYKNKVGFTVFDLFNLILDFEINRGKINKRLLFNGLLWNEEKDGYQILWED